MELHFWKCIQHFLEPGQPGESLKIKLIAVYRLKITDNLFTNHGIDILKPFPIRIIQHFTLRAFVVVDVKPVCKVNTQ